MTYFKLLSVSLIGMACFLGLSKARAHDKHHSSHSAGDASVIETVKSGDWSSPETWKDGQVPGAFARVLIKPEHAVVYDIESDQVIRGIQISGRLEFSKDKNTRLEVGLIRVENLSEYCEDGFDCQLGTPEHEHHQNPSVPTLEIGTSEHPIAQGSRAIIRLHYIEGMDKESCPAIICCGGRMDIHGQPMERTWVKLPYQTAKVGEAKVVLPNPLPGWSVGDRVILTGTTRQFGYIGTRHNKGGEPNSVADTPTTEERTIKSIRPWGGIDTKLQIATLDAPLKFDHLGAGEFRGEIANLSRNVVIESAKPDGIRGHTMYHRDSKGSISYAEFRHLGKKDVLGKYPIHYHLTGDTMRGSSIIGASIWDSHNRWVTVHGAQYLVVKDCVGYKSIGHGYFFEDGTEVFNIFDRNLAVMALRGKPLPKQVLPYDNNLGSGFWWANSLNTFTNNVAVECDEDGYRYEVFADDHFDPNLNVLHPDGKEKVVDIRTLPFVRFDGNEAHCQRLFAINLGGFPSRKPGKVNPDVAGVGPDGQHPFLLRNTKVWNSHWAFHSGAPSVKLEDFAMHDCAYGIWRCVMERHEYLKLTFSQVNTTVFFPRASGPADYNYESGDYFDLDPKDDLPPVTVITNVQKLESGMVRVTGVTSDNYEVKQVLVNQQAAIATGENFASWQIDLPTTSITNAKVIASASDVHGNAEAVPHEWEISHLNLP